MALNCICLAPISCSVLLPHFCYEGVLHFLVYGCTDTLQGTREATILNSIIPGILSELEMRMILSSGFTSKA